MYATCSSFFLKGCLANSLDIPAGIGMTYKSIQAIFRKRNYMPSDHEYEAAYSREIVNINSGWQRVSSATEKEFVSSLLWVACPTTVELIAQIQLQSICGLSMLHSRVGKINTFAIFCTSSLWIPAMRLVESCFLIWCCGGKLPGFATCNTLSQGVDLCTVTANYKIRKIFFKYICLCHVNIRVDRQPASQANIYDR